VVGLPVTTVLALLEDAGIDSGAHPA